MPLKQQATTATGQDRVSPARKVACDILRRINSEGRFAVDLLQSGHMAGLGDADRRLVTELVMGVLRWQGDLDFQIERLSGRPLHYFDPEVAVILRLGIYQIRFLQKIPKPAAVNESVELVRAVRKHSAAGLVNAVLRKCQPPVRPTAASPGAATRGRLGYPADTETVESARRSLPNWLFKRWERHFGRDAAHALALASVGVPPTTLRLSGGPKRIREVQERLAEAGVTTLPGQYADSALIVGSGDVQAPAVLAEGHAVQDEASQLVAALVAPAPGNCILDLCAAPGMKAGQLGSAMNEGVLIACDFSPRRLRTMSSILPRIIPAGVLLQLVRLDATRELPFIGGFDRVLLDAPCSGTGTLARNPEIKRRLEPSDLERLAAVQARMLERALDTLRSDGRLVYSTCSLEPEENEEVVRAVLERHRGFRLLGREELAQEFPRLRVLFDQDGYFRTRPDLHKMDGFFAAVIVPKR